MRLISARAFSEQTVGRRVLVDRDLDRRLHRDGFVKVPVLSSDAAHELRRRYLALHGEEGLGFSIDLTNDDLEYRQAAARLAADAVDSPCRSLFHDHVPFLHSFLCKYPGPDSEMYLHQDWSYVDERTGARTFVVWIALQDITGHNGQLRLLRGSHRLDPMPRGSNLAAGFIRHEGTIEERLLSVPVTAGEAIIFDNGTVHCSYPNQTSEPRVALAVGMRPSCVQLSYFRLAGPGQASRYSVDERFFFDYTPQALEHQPPSLPVEEVVEFDEQAWDETTLRRLLDRGLLSHMDRAARLVDRIEAELRRLPRRGARRLIRLNEKLIERYGPPGP